MTLYELGPARILKRLNLVDRFRAILDVGDRNDCLGGMRVHIAQSRSPHVRAACSKRCGEATGNVSGKILASRGTAALQHATPIQVPRVLVNMSVVPESRVGR